MVTKKGLAAFESLRSEKRRGNPETFELEPVAGMSDVGARRRNLVRSEESKGNGAPGEIRTPDLQLRRLPLYPAELRARG